MVVWSCGRVAASSWMRIFLHDDKLHTLSGNRGIFGRQDSENPAVSIITGSSDNDTPKIPQHQNIAGFLDNLTPKIPRSHNIAGFSGRVLDSENPAVSKNRLIFGRLDPENVADLSRRQHENDLWDDACPHHSMDRHRGGHHIGRCWCGLNRSNRMS